MTRSNTWSIKISQNSNNKETEIGRKTFTYIFQATNKQNFTKENKEMAKEQKFTSETESIRTNYICCILNIIRHSLLEKYSSHFIWKGWVWEGAGDRTELLYIDPHSIGHNRVSFPFSRAAQPEAWGPSLSGTCSSIQHLISNSSDPQLLSREPDGFLCWVLAFCTASCHQRVWSPN